MPKPPHRAALYLNVPRQAILAESFCIWMKRVEQLVLWLCGVRLCLTDKFCIWMSRVRPSYLNKSLSECVVLPLARLDPARLNHRPDHARPDKTRPTYTRPHQTMIWKQRYLSSGTTQQNQSDWIQGIIEIWNLRNTQSSMPHHTTQRRRDSIIPHASQVQESNTKQHYTHNASFVCARLCDSDSHTCTWWTVQLLWGQTWH